jgi:hypothetical protein
MKLACRLFRHQWHLDKLRPMCQFWHCSRCGEVSESWPWNLSMFGCSTPPTMGPTWSEQRWAELEEQIKREAL